MCLYVDMYICLLFKYVHILYYTIESVVAKILRITKHLKCLVMWLLICFLKYEN